MPGIIGDSLDIGRVRQMFIFISPIKFTPFFIYPDIPQDFHTVLRPYVWLIVHRFWLDYIKNMRLFFNRYSVFYSTILNSVTNFRMKKIIVIAVILLAGGYLFYQNGSLWLLKLMALTSGSGSGRIAPVAAAGPTPPFKDGIYTGSVQDAFYGKIQVKAVISGGKITDVNFLQYPNDRTRSIAINTLAMPNLKQEAISAQSANVDIVSGATDSSNAFVQSLASALSQAK